MKRKLATRLKSWKVQTCEPITNDHLTSSSFLDQAWFRFSGGVASMSECSEASYFCAAFGNHCIALYSTLNVQDSLPILRVINLEGLVNPGLLRSVVARATQLYIALFSGSDGIVVLDTW